MRNVDNRILHLPVVRTVGGSVETIDYPLPAAKSTFNRTNENISWAAWSWNVVTGCLAGCEYCYAREIALRSPQAYPAGFKPVFHPERLDAPRNTAMPKDAYRDPTLQRVFCNSMSDVYGRWVPEKWIDQVHAACIANSQWEYLFLTKFPQRYVRRELPATGWFGASVDRQFRVKIVEEAFSRISGVRIKWLSCEPMLEPLRFNDLSLFDWIVIGGQRATQQPDGFVPAFHPPLEWVEDLTEQAHKAGCKVWHKPNLRFRGMKMLQEFPRHSAQIPQPDLFA
jgi:protein gp37